MADPTAWIDQSACAYIDPELFYPPSEGTGPNAPHRVQVMAAKAICEGCPVREQCFRDAMDTPKKDDYGIRGGYTSLERNALRKKRERPLVACDECGAEYQRNAANQRYCGTECSRRAHLRQQVASDKRRESWKGDTITCAFCGEEHQSTRAKRQKYCSISCSSHDQWSKKAAA